MTRHVWVQTPSRWFPVKPHFITPVFHWLPKRWQHRLARYTGWGLVTKPSTEYCQSMVEEIRLLDAKELARLFPGTTLIKERFLGLTKVLIVVR